MEDLLRPDRADCRSGESYCFRNNNAIHLVPDDPRRTGCSVGLATWRFEVKLLVLLLLLLLLMEGSSISR